jgi:ABC-type transporter Mla subunit MlaD
MKPMSMRGSTPAKQSESTMSGEAEVVVNGVFLSPRVVDRRAYSELSEELRDLVRHAASERSAITSVLDQAGKATQEFRQREQSQQGNIELTARALKSMDERSARIEQLLAQATEQARVFEKLEAQAGSLIDSKIQILESRLQAVTGGAAAQAEALEERVRRASRELEQRIEAIRRDAQSIAGPAQEALNKACERAGMLAGSGAGSLGDLVARGERVAQTAEGIASTLEGATARVERDRAAIDEIQTRSVQVERNLEIVRSRLNEQQTESLARAQEAIDGVQLMLAQVREQTSAARGEGASAVAELRSVIQQSQDAHNTTTLALKVLAKSIEQAKGITEQLEPWRAVLEGNETGKMPEPIRRMIEGVRGELKGELSSIAGALRAAADRAERTEQALASLPMEPVTKLTPRSEPAPVMKHETVKPQPAKPESTVGHPLVAARVSSPPILP